MALVSISTSTGSGSGSFALAPVTKQSSTAHTVIRVHRLELSMVLIEGSFGTGARNAVMSQGFASNNPHNRLAAFYVRNDACF